MQIETVITCVNYDDFLRITLPRNMLVLSSITVLTSPKDHRTIGIARTYGSKLMTTNSWQNGGPFNKGRALNEWLERTDLLVASGVWILVLDADILLPTDIPLEVNHLDPTGLYSARRRICHEYGSFCQFAMGLRPLNTFPISVPPIVNGRVWGHRPTSNPAGLQGYMQLWCPSQCCGMTRFPESGTAAQYDVEFALSFPESRRDFLQNYEVLHLGPPRVNWTGRISSRWGEHP